MKQLISVNHNSKRITKADKNFENKLDFQDIKFTLKTRDIHITEKKISWALAFLVNKIRKTSNLCIKKLLRRKKC